MAAMDTQAVCDWIAQVAPGGKLASDSRRIKPGDVFFAYPGDAGDGRSFIGQAIAQGAAAVVHDERDFAWDPQWEVPHLALADLKKRAGPIAHAAAGMPDAAMFTVGVTGTNGKTSCAVWLGQALARLGAPAAVIGTLGVGMFRAKGEVEYDVTGYTTPDAVLLAEKLAEVKSKLTQYAPTIPRRQVLERQVPALQERQPLLPTA